MGYNPAKATDLMDGLFKAALQLSAGHGGGILHHNHPELRHTQFVSLHQQHQAALQVLANSEIKRVTPSYSVPI